MKLHWTFSQSSRSAAICAAATMALGLLCLFITPVRFWFERLSYDLPFYFSPPIPLDEVVIVERDEKSYRELNQQPGQLWDRELYVPALDRFTEDRARLAVFDMSLADSGTPAGNTHLASAIRRNGHVVLGVDFRKLPKLEGGYPLYPRDEFKDAAAGLGLILVLQDKVDGVVRQMNPGTPELPTLAWEAAARAGLKPELLSTRMAEARWLNYPSSLEQLRRISFVDVTNQAPGFFSNRCVFLGGSPQVKLEGQQTDIYPTPFYRWSGAPQPGVVIQAISFLNLIHGRWLEQMSPTIELLLISILGALGAIGLSLFRPWLGAVLAFTAAVIVFAAACSLVFLAHSWFSWGIFTFVQLPFAFSWSVVAQSKRLAREKEIVSSQLELERKAVERLLPATESEAATIRSDVVEAAEVASGTGISPSPAAQPEIQISPLMQAGRWVPPSVPDHKLVRCIGEGAYGQVWLARDVIGTYHAVKFVFRNTFNSDAPYEREFKGIHHFTPISRMHPGFVNILHVGRNDGGGYFFYIMELADDETTGQTIQPQTYAAKTLSRIIRKQGRLKPEDCVKLAMELSSALEFLHQRRLIHRDIKPSNVLFVHGQAKFADVGLVTQIDTKRAEATYIGTEGYIAPEGPGTAGADIYSLGKVFYEATMGMDRMRFPDLPTAVVQESSPLLMSLNQVILKACEFNPRERYQTAQQLYDDLKALL